MMNMLLRGFWGYSRTTDVFGAKDYCDLMQRRLKEEFPDFGIQLFRDTSDVVNEHWAISVIRHLSKSALFFWWQSERWMRRAACVFEMEVFLGRIKTVAKEFEVDPEQLRTCLIWPIRAGEIREERWLNLEPEQHWLRVLTEQQVDPRLDLAELVHACHPWADDKAANVNSVVPKIRRRLEAAIPALNHNLLPLLEFLNEEDRRFIEHWQDEFEYRFRSQTTIDWSGDRPKIPSRDEKNWLSKQKLAARRHTEGRTRQSSGLGFELILVPAPAAACEGSFWVSSQPWDKHRVQDAHTDNAGNIVYPLQIAKDIALAVQRYALALPSEDQARVLEQIFRELDVPDRLGFKSRVTGFWYQSAEHGVSPSIQGRTHLSVLLVKPLVQG